MADTAAAPGIDLDDPQTWESASFMDLAEAGLRGELPPATEGTQQPGAQPIETVGVATKDGQHVIPFAELAQTREQLLAERSAREALEAEIAVLRAAQQPAAGVPQETPTTTWEGRDEALARVAAARGDGDDELAAALQLGVDAKDQAIAKAAQLDALMQRIERMEQGAATQMQQSDDAARDAAFESNPVMGYLHELAQAGNPGYWNAALNLAREWERTPQWAALDWTQRFAQIAQTVQTQFGLQLPATDMAGAPSQPAPTAAVPPSLTHIPGRQAIQPAVRGMDDLAGLPVRQQQQQLVALYGQGKFFDALDALPIGSLNSDGGQFGQ